MSCQPAAILFSTYNCSFRHSCGAGTSLISDKNVSSELFWKGLIPAVTSVNVWHCRVPAQMVLRLCSFWPPANLAAGRVHDFCDSRCTIQNPDPFLWLISRLPPICLLRFGQDSATTMILSPTLRSSSSLLLHARCCTTTLLPSCNRPWWTELTLYSARR